MTKLKSYIQVLGLLSLALFVGCTQIPKADLSIYTESFNTTRSVAETVLVDYEAALKEIEAIRAADAARTKKVSPFKPAFDPARALNGTSRDADVVARLQVLETIATYNGVLVTLAEGKSVEEVQGSMAAFTGSLEGLLNTFGAVVPGLSAAQPIVETLLAEAEKARLREEFKKAIAKGEPIIEQIIDEGLIQDTVQFYGIRKTLADQDLILVQRKGKVTAKIISTISAEHADPPSGSSLETSKGTSAKKLKEALELLEAQETTFKLKGQDRSLGDLTGHASGTPPYSELVQVRIDQLIEKTETFASQYQKIMRDTNEYYELLNSYVRLLNQTKTTLKNVRVQLDSPGNITAMARQLAVTAVKLKGDFEAFREERG